jgi:hypothetical protein
VDIDPVAWKAEVERVAPRLKAAAASIGGSMVGRGFGGGAAADTGGEWRLHLEATRTSETTIANTLPSTLKALERLGSDLHDLLEGVSGQERYINSTFKTLAQQYAEASATEKRASFETSNLQQRVTALSAELAGVSEDLEDVKGRMEEKGSNMTDTSPLIKIKAALQTLRTESAALDVQAGVIAHAVMQSRLSHKFMPGGAQPADDSDDDEDEEGEEGMAGDGTRVGTTGSRSQQGLASGGSSGQGQSKGGRSAQQGMQRGGRGQFADLDEDEGGFEDSTAFRGLASHGRGGTHGGSGLAADPSALNQVASSMASGMRQVKGMR